MTYAFQGNAQSRSDLAGGSHPRDNTLRVQLVTKQANPKYARLLDLFEQATGRGGLLNTSFNLHGEPIVYTPKDAVDVFLRSGLEVLVLDRHILTKRTGQAIQ